ncbi:unnamed protein product [Notodromas monacha]|uniref:Uncharacterized protein n=1 Tax=Notodromas monacha TaxID=399045 RepID=A0A7R9C303_9CRUS|nr:unnamed protein product [Notodromas monacha]CAG0925517.1 unnamed protein product [Notodromas monacha]
MHRDERSKPYVETRTVDERGCQLVFNHLPPLPDASNHVSTRFRASLLLATLLLVLASCFSLSRGAATTPPAQLLQDEVTMEFQITTMWDSVPVQHNPVSLTLTGKEDHLELRVEAPFFNDVAPPCAEPGPCFGLWDYEVVEAFFLAPDNKYIEIEVGPLGHHLILLLNGERNAIAQELPMEYSVTSQEIGGTWTATAKIPVGYFPPKVERWNAYAIHNNASNPLKRDYQSLFPVPTGELPAPDL